MSSWLRRLYYKWFKNTKIYCYCNIYKTAKVGRNCIIGGFSEIGDKVEVGNACKLGAYVFLPKGVTIGNEVFIGPRVTFTNDYYPKATGEWQLRETIIKDGASIGAGSVIRCGVTIGKNAGVGAGSVVLKDIPDGEVWAGNPARKIESKWKKGIYASGFGDKEQEAAG